ncbi:MAG TPA: four helix bundle protein [Tepidisphaeraceae bacterium]|nr:four helix bundle protein [Tepidisphaeraceae bacterium]
MALTHYRELIAWQRAMDLVVEVYRITQQFPQTEIYGLSNQLRRAAVSIPSNIAEGQGRGGATDFARYLRISNGSRQEVETQIRIARRLGYINDITMDDLIKLTEETGRLLSGLLKSIAPKE